jgi:hypothetical protein
MYHLLVEAAISSLIGTERANLVLEIASKRNTDPCRGFDVNAVGSLEVGTDT